MKPEFSKKESSPDGMAALALVSALIGRLKLAPDQMQHVLSDAKALLPPPPGQNTTEAHSMLAKMMEGGKGS